MCQGALMSADELELKAPQSTGRLAAEHRENSVAFKKQRACPSCAAAMVPLRIGQLEAWVERCTSCGLLWVEAADLRSLTMLAKKASVVRAYESLSDGEKHEMARDLAEATQQRSGPDLNPLGYALAMLGVPILEHVEGNRAPVLTFALVASLLASQLLLPTDELAYVAGSNDLGRLLTASFTHFGWVHLLGNAAFLVAFGDAVEQKVPRWLYAAGFIAVGATATYAATLVIPQGTLVGGASGAIAGAMSMAALVQPKARVTFTIGLRMPVALVPLWLYGLGWFVLQLALWGAGVGGIAFGAHVAGFVLGALLGLLVRWRQRARP